MKKINLISSLFFFLLCLSSHSLMAQSTSRTFVNQGSESIILKNGAQSMATVQSNREAKLTVNVGDVITVEVPSNPRKKWYPIYINEAKDRGKIYIQANVPYSESDARRRDEKHLSYGNNLDGVLITKYNPFAVVRSFSSKPIFRGIKNNSYDYDIRENVILVGGFNYNGSNQVGTGNKSSQLYVGVDNFKKELNIGLKSKFPLGNPAKAPTGSVDFSYNETQSRNLKETQYFFYSKQNVDIYGVGLGSLADVRLDNRFIEAVERLQTPQDADRFVQTYGTHYSTSVTYGGQYNSYIAIEERDFFQAESKGWDLAVGASFSQAGTQTKKPVKGGGETIEGSPESSEVASGELSVGQNVEKGARDIINKSKSEYNFVGGNGTFSNWTVDPDNSTSIGVELDLIYNLIHPYVFKTSWTDKQLAPKRALIEAAVEREIKKLPLLKPTTRTRIFNIKFRNFRLTDHSDDANKNIKGNFQVKTSNGKTLPLWNQGNYSGIFNNDLYSNPNSDWIVVKQKSDINGKFPPLSLTFEGSLTEQDDFVGEGDDDRMDIIGGKTLDISGLTGVKNHVVKFHHTYLSGTQRMTVEADISIRPGFGFADEFTPAGGLNRSGGVNQGGLHPRVSTTPAPNVRFESRPNTSSPSKPKPNPNPATPTASTGSFSYGNGNSEHQYLVGDWNGDGRDKLAIRRNNKLLYNFNLDGRHDKEQIFGNGNSESQYLAGDWNGDGKDNIAIRRNGKILYDFNFDGRHDLEQNFGNGNGESQYLVGDWNGDGRDNIAVRRNGKILYDFNFDGRHDLEQNYGNGNGEDQYLVGDWNGDGRDNIAVRRGNNILLDYNFDGRADKTISFGNGNSESEYLVGDWNGDGKDDIGVRRGSKIYINRL